MRMTAMVVLSLVALAPASFAAAPGYNLGWTSCALVSSTENLYLACDDNTLTKHLVVSFRLAEDMPDYVGASLRLDYIVGAGSPMPWWAFGAGGCREGAFAPVPVPAEVVGCTSAYLGGAQGGGSVVDFHGSNRWSLRADWARDAPAPLTAGTLYTAMVLRLTSAKSYDDGSGSGVCEGCERQACLWISTLEAYSYSIATPVTFYSADARGWVTYQGASLSDHGCVTPTRTGTWGAVKALYR